MGLSGQLEFEVEIKTPGSVFLEIYGSNKEHLPKICSHIVPRIDLLEGEWGQAGCVIMVYYSIVDMVMVVGGDDGGGCRRTIGGEGKEMTSKELVEEVDEKNKSITYNLLEGDLMKLYKTLRFTFQIITTNDAEFVKTKIEYEKVSEDAPYPDMLKDFVTAVTQTIDAYYSQVSNH
ncbi:kirola-like [Lycium barbarum]|uniref:kirola-like n=1 Tax=Lycium barbarum TaxID=112863 RepID=UPI00293EA0F6|nr:kirola-like [Lycium barbarum]